MTLDEQLAELEPLIGWYSRFFYVEGYDRDDLEQEARLALIRGLPGFDPAKGSNLRSFARLLIDRWLVTLLKTSHREKRGAGLRTLSLDAPAPSIIDGAEDDATLGDVVLQTRVPIDRQVEALEELRAIVRGDGLSRLEQVALIGFGLGLSYAELEPVVGDVKRIDNALQRARRKLAA